MSMDAEFREFLKRYDEDRKKADEDRRKADEDRRKADEDRRKADEDRKKADERFAAMMRRLVMNDQRIEKLMARSDRRERDLAKGLAVIGKRILDTQKDILETQRAILAALRALNNGRPGGGAGRN